LPTGIRPSHINRFRLFLRGKNDFRAKEFPKMCIYHPEMRVSIPKKKVSYDRIGFWRGTASNPSSCRLPLNFFFRSITGVAGNRRK
jgi:hypothetical protein